MSLSKPSVTDVRVIFPAAEGLPDATVQTMIDTAALIVGQCSAIAGYPEETQQAIIKWVAAHLLQVSGVATPGSSGIVTASKLGDAQDSYAAPTLGPGFASSFFGMQATLLDPSGCLVNLGKYRVRFKTV